MVATRRLNVFLDGVFIGQVEQSPQGQLSFSYDDAYREVPDATPLSMSIPLNGGRHGNKTVRAFLDGLLPDSQPARERWGQQYGVSPNNPFALLTHIGRDAAGAVQILPPEVDASDASERRGDIEWLSNNDFANIARELAEHGEDWDPGRFGGRWSLAGAQPKIALFRDPDTQQWGIPNDSTPTNCIVKPALRAFDQHHINEALCLRAAQYAGMLTADVDLVEVADVQAIISHRYDRAQNDDGRWVRVHQEDMCQALSVHPSLKYQSEGGPGVASIGALLQRLAIDDRTVSTERFFKGLAFNVLIGGTDAHAKNYSLVLIGNRVQVAPLYDVASAACYSQFERLAAAMKIGKHWKLLDVGTEDWERAGRHLALPPGQAEAWVDEMRGDLDRAFAEAVASLPAGAQGEASAMAERIVEHVHGAWRPNLDRDPRYTFAVDRPADGTEGRPRG
jgi:serine/threonine-protein kinase HipA